MLTDHVIYDHGDSFYVTNLSSLVAISIVVIVMFLLCNTISHAHVIKDLCDFMSRSPSSKSPT